jgi:hypothetical protein
MVVFDGTPKQIVMRMKRVSPGGTRLSLDEFIVANLAQLGLETEARAMQQTDDEHAAAFLKQMIAEGHARLLQAGE